ncbi:hypothetical protein pdam_00001931 [Pocillopora damicornis]|uniref:Endonuclease/exonuclease/phosphatase domain-containing protein n=1 Tax=Pocillopora damicornis TaxID=46731 RepID=A0A3M6TPW1_POCDA|nr:hypothetical protein pdam_00001931 [Pocillopora damicornis]
MTLLQRLAYSGDFDVVSITEIWLNATIFDSEILPGQRRTRWRSTDGTPEPLLELNSSLQENCESTCLIILSDFNLPKLDWSSDSSAHLIPGPTHISGNKLDLLLSNW